MTLVYGNERPLFIISLAISLLFWVVLLVGTVGIALLYVLGFFVFYLFAQSAFISYLKGTAVRITPQQFPDLHARVLACCEKLGMKEPPDAYLMHGNGIFNALATRFLGRNFIVLYSDVIDALEEQPGAVNFYIGHELGHIQRGHLSWMPVLFPAGILPLLGAAYSRAREYTCDRHGLACVASPQDAAAGLAALAAGARRWRGLSHAAYTGQAKASSGFWMSFHELTGDYPWLVKRMGAVQALGNRQAPKPPRRHPLAFVLALIVPRFGVGGGAASLLVMVAIIGVLAAIAIPAYQEYVTRASVMSAQPRVETVKQAIVDYVVKNQAWPDSPQAVGIDPAPGAYGPDIESVEFGEGASIVVTYAKGAAAGKSLVWTLRVSNDQLVWQCANDGLPPKAVPANCR